MNYCNPLGDNWTSTQDADKYHDIPKDKYYCVNLGIRHTVEFRLWRGTLNYQSFIASLEMTDLLLQTSKELTWEEVKNLGFWGLIRRAEKYNYTELYGYVARIFKKTFNVEYSKDDTETPIDIKDFKAMMKQLAMAA
jgi:hypothetical protein